MDTLAKIEQQIGATQTAIAELEEETMWMKAFLRGLRDTAREEVGDKGARPSFAAQVDGAWVGDKDEKKQRARNALKEAREAIEAVHGPNCAFLGQIAVYAAQLERQA